jgi:hypothetical protein
MSNCRTQALQTTDSGELNKWIFELITINICTSLCIYLLEAYIYSYIQPKDPMSASHIPKGYHLLQERTEANNDHRPTRRLSKDGDQARGAKRYINKQPVNGRNYLPAPIWTERTPYRTTEVDGQKANTTSSQRHKVDRVHWPVETPKYQSVLWNVSSCASSKGCYCNSA